MTGDPPTRPREVPKQPRAHQTRERLITATMELLGEAGPTGISTNRIAAKAGYSIGTLYRYFPDKQPLITLVRERVFTEIEIQVSQSVLAAMELALADGVTAILHSLTSAIAARRSVLLALLEDQPSAVEAAQVQDFERRLFPLARAYLVHHLGPRPKAELDTIVYVGIGIGVAAALRIGLTPPSDLDPDRVLAETARMITIWLDTL